MQAGRNEWHWVNLNLQLYGYGCVVIFSSFPQQTWSTTDDILKSSCEKLCTRFRKKRDIKERRRDFKSYRLDTL